MMLDVQYIHKAKVYRIKNRKTNKYLTSGVQLITEPGSIGKIQQFWLLDEVKPTSYEIVCLKTGQVLSRKDSLILEKGNWSGCQLWKLERAELDHCKNYFWLIAKDDESLTLFGSSASNKVSMKNFDRTLFVSNWQLEQIDLDKQLAGCCTFKSAYSGMVIDVPEGSSKNGVSIIQYHSNGRGNQMWILQKIIDCFVIRNLCSNLILVPQKRILKAGTKIVQTEFQNRDEDKWKLEKIDNGRFLLRNKGEQTYYLGVSSNKQSSQIQLVSQKQKGIWMLEGSIPILLNI